MSFDHVAADRRVHLEALDARQAWPPLLRPGVLAGHEVYGEWESRLIRDFLTPVVEGGDTLAAALAKLLCWTDTLRAWRPADGALEVLARRPVAITHTRRLLGIATHGDFLGNVRATLLGRVAAAWRPASWPAGLTDASDDGAPVTREDADAALARYLATRLVGSWVTYQGQGLRSVAASLVSAYALTALALEATLTGKATAVSLGLMTSSIRASDWLLLHLLDREDWADWCGQFERDSDARALLALVGAAAGTLDSLHWQPPVRQR